MLNPIRSNTVLYFDAIPQEWINILFTRHQLSKTFLLSIMKLNESNVKGLSVFFFKSLFEEARVLIRVYLESFILSLYFFAYYSVFDAFVPLIGSKFTATVCDILRFPFHH